MTTLYYPCWISPGRRAGGWSFGPPCDTAGAAANYLRERIRQGATLGCVVEMRGQQKTPLADYVYPPAAKKIIAHWEELWDATENA